MTPYTYLITGATSGIGRAAALALAKPGTRLILTGRNKIAGEQVARRCQRAGDGVEAVFIPADLGCKREVLRLSEAVRTRVTSLDVLINNAGARFDRYKQTEDGIEQAFAINHLSHFVLTAMLMDRLLAAPSARVVVTGSGTHSGASCEGNWCLSQAEWNRTVAYSKSKLANIVFAYELARRTKGTGVTSNAMDPGGVATRFARNNGLKAWLKHLIYYVLKGRLISARRGADTIVYLATDPSLQGRSGGYYMERAEIRSSPASYDNSAAKNLWKLSLDLSGLKNHLSGAPEPVRRVVLDD